MIHIEGRQITPVGERYGWPSDASHFVWWTKGDEATLTWKTTEGEVPILACIAQ